jgi:hypothetical protein
MSHIVFFSLDNDTISRRPLPIPASVDGDVTVKVINVVAGRATDPHDW